MAGSSPPGAPAAPVEPPTARAPRPAPAPGTGNNGQAVFAATIPANCSADKSAGKARMCACLAQYNANKINGGNGGLKWIQKGGGYYSKCNKRLKGSA